MNTRYAICLVVAALVALAACDPGARMSEQGFRLPDGDPQAGRQAFLDLQCHGCHSIEGIALPEIPGQEPPFVELGGDVTRVKAYGELVTAIINPSHRLARGYALSVISEAGESKMRVYNRHMTVQQLIDLVMFLQPTYDVVPPEYAYRAYPTRP